MPTLLQRVIIGEEDIPYLQQMIYGSIKKTETENLLIMPCGPLPKNPGELLSTQQMSFFISFLKRRFDFIVIDTPPIIPASDALILAPFVDGTLLIARAGKTNRQLVKKAVDQIKASKANLLGVVLNELDFKREGYYKYYTKYYGKTE
jgi:capsular exopolysaccharide synthesis family protein